MTQHKPSPSNVCEIINSNISFFKQGLEEECCNSIESLSEEFAEKVGLHLDFDRFDYAESDQVKEVAIKILFNDFVQFSRGKHDTIEITTHSELTLIEHFDKEWTRFLPKGWRGYICEEIARTDYLSKLKPENFCHFIDFYSSCWRRDYDSIYSISAAWACIFKFTNWDRIKQAMRQGDKIKKAQSSGAQPAYRVKKLDNYNLIFKGSSSLEVALTRWTSDDASQTQPRWDLEDSLDRIFKQWPDIEIDKKGKKLKTIWWADYLQLLQETEQGSLGRQALSYPLAATADYLSKFRSIDPSISAPLEVAVIEGLMDEQLLHIGKNFSGKSNGPKLRSYIQETPAEFLWGDLTIPNEEPHQIWHDCLLGTSARIQEVLLPHNLENPFKAMTSISGLRRQYRENAPETNYFSWLSSEKGIPLAESAALALLNMRAESMRRVLYQDLVREHIIPMFLSITISELGPTHLKESQLGQLFETYHGGQTCVEMVAEKYKLSANAVSEKLYSFLSFADILKTVFPLDHDNDSCSWA